MVTKKVGVEAILVPVTNAGHGNFGTPEVANRLRAFFYKHLLKRAVLVSDEPIHSNAPASK